MIEPGDIFERKNGRKTERIVVYLVREPTQKIPSAAVFYDNLGSSANAGAKIGPGAIGRFIGEWGAPTSKMSVGGAYKLFRRERHRSNQLKGEVDRLRRQISELG